MRRFFLTVGVLALVAAATTACIAGNTTVMDSDDALQQVRALAEFERSQGHDEQADFMEDGNVTLDELHRSFDLLRSCIDSAGLTISDPFMNPASGNDLMYTVHLGTREQTSAIEDLEDCEQQYWETVSTAYQLLNPPRSDEPLRQQVISCLESAGISVSGEEANVEEFVNATGAIDEVVECYQSSLEALYPDAPSIAISY